MSLKKMFQSLQYLTKIILFSFNTTSIKLNFVNMLLTEIHKDYG